MSSPVLGSGHQEIKQYLSQGAHCRASFPQQLSGRPRMLQCFSVLGVGRRGDGVHHVPSPSPAPSSKSSDQLRFFSVLILKNFLLTEKLQKCNEASLYALPRFLKCGHLHFAILT